MGYEGGELHHLFKPELADAACHDMAVDGGKWLHRRVRELTPVHEEFGGGAGRWAAVNRERGRAPGTLKRSWYLDPLGVKRRVTPFGPTFSAKVATDDPIAPFVEDDTRPHIIRPKRPGGMLRFRVWPSGIAVYARFVRHPGTTGQHMMLRAQQEARVDFRNITVDRARLWAVQQMRHCMRANA